jgi:hypothetical protein
VSPSFGDVAADPLEPALQQLAQARQQKAAVGRRQLRPRRGRLAAYGRGGTALSDTSGLPLLRTSGQPRASRPVRRARAAPRAQRLGSLSLRVHCSWQIEHTFRFLKQTLGWSTPRMRHPEQADRWSWLIVAAFTQLRLARACVADSQLPWERHYAAGRLTPWRIHRAVSSLLPTLGTPAKPPKPCGRSPGRPKGRRSGRAKRYPALKKAA